MPSTVCQGICGKLCTPQTKPQVASRGKGRPKASRRKSLFRKSAANQEAASMPATKPALPASTLTFSGVSHIQKACQYKGRAGLM